MKKIRSSLQELAAVFSELPPGMQPEKQLLMRVAERDIPIDRIKGLHRNTLIELLVKLDQEELQKLQKSFPIGSRVDYQKLSKNDLAGEGRVTGYNKGKVVISTWMGQRQIDPGRISFINGEPYRHEKPSEDKSS